MATDPSLVQEVPEKVRLKIEHEGKEASYTISSLKVGATDEQLYNTGSGIGMLRRAPVKVFSKLVDYRIELK